MLHKVLYIEQLNLIIGKFKRNNFRLIIKKKLDKERQKNNISKSIQLDDQSLTLANALFATVGQTIQINNQNMKKGKKGLIPTQINALANALATAQRTAKLALGEATHNIDATVNENNDSFRRAMELLDEVEKGRIGSIQATH